MMPYGNELPPLRRPTRRSQPPLPSVHIENVLPPHSIEAEQSTLGAMLIENRAMLKGMELLSAADFYRDAHQIIFESFERLVQRGQPADFVTLREHLQAQNKLAAIGGISYLTALFDTVPTAANLEYYASIVAQKSLLRTIQAAGRDVVALSMRDDEDAEALLEEAEQLIFSLKKRGTLETGSPIRDTILAFENKIAALEDNPSSMLGAKSGLIAYDDATNGLQAGDLSIFLGSSGMGKSALMGKVAVAIALYTGPVLISSNEMSREQLYLRMACEMAGVDSFALRRGRLEKEEWERYQAARDVLYDLPIFIDDRSSQSPGYIRSVARRVAAKYGSLAAIFGDYIQIMSADDPSGNETQDLGQIANGMKNMARDMKIPIVLLSQINRNAESRDNKRPTLADIRQSGEIAQAADVICGIYREEYYSMRGVQGLDSGRTQEVELIFLKHRNGPECVVKVGFVARYTQFADLNITLPDGSTGF